LYREFEGALNSHPLKGNITKAVRANVLETYPLMEPYMEEVWPKKAQVLQLKIKGDNLLSFYQIDGEVKFMEIRDYPVLPMLRVLHAYPFMMDPMQCDKGAIKHIFSGSHVMAPGLTSAGGCMTEGLKVMHPVAVTAEGKKHAMAVGVLKMSVDDIKTKNKGEAIEIIQFMNDAVWKIKGV
jgi:malignant T-cell-amplified sequence